MCEITAETKLVVASELTASTTGVTLAASPLDAKIANALADANTPAETFLKLFREAENALDAADEAAEKERERSLDPATADPEKAQAMLQKIELGRDRLNAALPKLQARYEQARARERVADWAAEYEQFEQKRDALARELTEVYPAAVEQLVDLFERIMAVDREIDQVNGSAPRSDPRRLKGIELTARELDHFTDINPPIARELRLPHPGETSRLAFPPHVVNFSVQASEKVARAMAERGAAYGPDWHSVRQLEIGPPARRYGSGADVRRARARAVQAGLLCGSARCGGIPADRTQALKRR